VVAVPVFFGLALFPEDAVILPGITWEAVGRVCLSMIAVAVFCGRAFLANTLAVTALIVSPVVFAGGLVSWLLAVGGGTAPGMAGSPHGVHYVGLVLNMLSVIPMALALVASIPFDRMEQRLLRRSGGISRGQKYLLMFVRVFNHIVYFVIPNLLEVMREEALLRDLAAHRAPGRTASGIRGRIRPLLAGLIHAAVCGICASLRFIPLWAREIADLPDRTPQ
jgi:hypothetical protein